MDEPKSGSGAGTIDDLILHYGTKGMRWGVQKEVGSSVPKGPTEVTLKGKVGTKVRATGGQHQPASEDAKNVAVSKRMALKSTTDSLSTKDLQAMVLRMNLEQQYTNLKDNPTPNDKMDKGRTFAKKAVKEYGPTAVVGIGTAVVTKNPTVAGASAILKAVKVAKFLADNKNQKKKKK